MTTDYRLREPLVFVAIAAVSVGVFLHAMSGAPRLNESFWIDGVWLDQFVRELAHGNLYPRWLPLSHHGLGSPVFYYYPPLCFYLGSLFEFAGLSTYAAIVATFIAASMLSGVGVYLWSKGQSRTPLAGALVYVIVRGRGMTERQMAKAADMQASQADYIKQVAGTSSAADQIAGAKALLDSGAIDQGEFDTLKAKALS